MKGEEKEMEGVEGEESARHRDGDNLATDSVVYTRSSKQCTVVLHYKL